MKFIWLFLFPSFYLFGQGDNDYFLISKIKVGMTFDGYGSYQFSDIPGVTATRLGKPKPSPIYPGFSVGVSLESPTLINFYETNLSLALELSYGQATTGKVKTYTGDSRYTLTSLPILLWTSIKTKGTIVPFLRIGVGTERTQILEKHYSAPQSDYEIKEWFFCWGVGAGIDLNVSTYKISLFVDAILKENGISDVFQDGKPILSDYRSAVTFCGIQFGYPF